MAVALLGSAAFFTDGITESDVGTVDPENRTVKGDLGSG